MNKLLSFLIFSIFMGSFQVEAGPHYYAMTRKKSHTHFLVEYKADKGISHFDFTDSKKKIEGMILNLTALGFLPVKQNITFKLSYQDFLKTNSGMILNIKESDKKIESYVLSFFFLPSKIETAHYYPLNTPSLEEFMVAVQKVEARFNFFKKGQLPLALPYGFKVKISPVKMKGGSIFLKNDTLCLQPSVSDFSVEMLLAGFVNVPKID